MATTVDVYGDGTGNNGDFELLDDCSNSSDQDIDGVGNAFATNASDTAIFVATDGTSNKYQAKSVTDEFGFAGVFNATNSWDVSGKHVYCWVRSLDPFQVEGFNTDEGIIMRISEASNGASPYDQHEVGGQDTRRVAVEGFLRLCFDSGRTPDEEAGTIDLTDIDGVYVGGTMQSGSGQNTYFIDNFDAGSFARVFGGGVSTQANSAGIAANTDIFNSGIFKFVQGAYYLLAGFKFGEVAGTAAAYYLDSGEVWICEDQNVANDLYTFTVDGNSTGIQSFILGVKVGSGATATGVGGNTIVATQEPFNFICTDADVDAFGLYGCNFLNANLAGGTFEITNANVEVLSSLFSQCGQIELGSTTAFRFNTVTDSTETTLAALECGSINPGASDQIRDLNIQNCQNGMGFTGTVDTTIDLKNVQFAGNTDDIRIDFDAGDTITINMLEGSTSDGGNLVAADVNNVNGSTLIINNDPQTSLVHVDDNTGADLQNARVLLEAADGAGDLPFDDTITLTAVAAVATAAHTAHGMTAGDKVVIRDAVEVLYNGVFAITNISANAYDYTMAGSPSSPATGTIKATGAVLEGLTDVNGDISASREWGSNTNVKGFARKSTASPRFKSFNLAGNTVLSATGLTINVRLVLDE